MPPIGRATKPTPNVAKASSVPVTGRNVGKNSRLKTRAAAVPYRKKSYHSMIVPATAAAASPASGSRDRPRSLSSGGWSAAAGGRPVIGEGEPSLAGSRLLAKSGRPSGSADSAMAGADPGGPPAGSGAGPHRRGGSRASAARDRQLGTPRRIDPWSLLGLYVRLFAAIAVEIGRDV